MAHVDAETLEALNALLQDARASVEVEVALSNGATERTEREMLVSIGVEEVGLCCLLHEHLEATGVFVTRHVNGIALTIINTEQYDERLHAFALHQMDSGQRARELSTIMGDTALSQLLVEVHDAHARSALWSEQRASQFASSRTLEFQSDAEKPSSARESAESSSISTAGSRQPDSSPPSAPNLTGTTVIPSKEGYNALEDEENWSGDSYRPSATRENYPMDDE
jgi:hypothetical protein